MTRSGFLSEEATMAVSIAINSSDSGTVYDNFKQMEGVKEQRMADNSVGHHYLGR